jgi:molecular chaperone GrpE
VTDAHQQDIIEQGTIVSSSGQQVENSSASADAVSSTSESITQVESEPVPYEDSTKLPKDIAFLRESLSSIEAIASVLQKDFETKIKYDESKERTINLLHQELQGHRNNLNFQHLRPLVMELVSLYDDMSKAVIKYDVESQSTELKCFSTEISHFLQDIEDMLSRHGFEIYQTDSDIFDRTLQNAQKSIEINNPDLDKHIASRVRKGLRYDERVVRPEMVTVYKYVAKANQVNETS